MTTKTQSATLEASEARRVWELTVDAWEQRFRSTQSDDMAKPTPCAEWDVRALVEHATDAQTRLLAAVGRNAAWLPPVVNTGERNPK